MWVTITEYARMRNVSPPAVRCAITDGRIKNGARKNPKGKYEVNPEVADIEWRTNTDPSMRRNVKDLNQKYFDDVPVPHIATPVEKIPEISPPPYFRTEEPQSPQLTALKESRAKLELYKALLAEQEFKKNAENLINAEEVKAVWFKIITEAKTKIMSLPSKAKANIPHLTLNEVATLDNLVRECLEDLAENGVAL